MAPTHYDTLHVSQTASPEAIKAAYRQQCQKWHPDKNPENHAEAEKIIKMINAAYEILSDPTRRRQYDATLSRHEPVKRTITEEEIRRRTAQQQYQQQYQQEARRRAAEHAQRWMEEEIRRATAQHRRPSAGHIQPKDSLLSQLKFALSFLCMLCIFSWLVVMFLTA